MGGYISVEMTLDATNSAIGRNLPGKHLTGGTYNKELGIFSYYKMFE